MFESVRTSHVLSPAKINLFLQVVGKRSDNYHDLFTLMCCISLYDSIDFVFDTSDISVSCSHPQVPENESNLVYKAADLFYKKLGKPGGVGISIDKKIPVGAGLGGGSSNAAAVLCELNRYFHSPFSQEMLRYMGREIGADVPFFITGEPAIATGIGDRLKPFHGMDRYYVVLINPGFSVSTADVYKNLNLGLTKCEKIIKKIPFDGSPINICELLCNDLETVTANMHPDIDSAKALLMRLGAEGALMTGSGPTIFGLFSDADQARYAFNALHHLSAQQRFLAELII